MYKQALKTKLLLKILALATIPKISEHKEPRVMTVEEQEYFLNMRKIAT